jgi:hypothetical protein
MLPSPVQLREQSRIYREAAREATGAEAKRHLAAYAFALAQIAEAIGREKRGANTERFERMLTDALGQVLEVAPSELRAIVDRGEQRAAAAQRDRIKVWRARAEELRTTADNFTVPSAQESLRRAAANYDSLADEAEAKLAGRRAPKDQAG